MKAISDLKILKDNLPEGDVEEKFVNEYHSILTAAQNQINESLREHFIPADELKRRLGPQQFDDYGKLIEASYSSARYCARNFFMFKIDKAVTHLDSIRLERHIERSDKATYALPKIPLTEPESLWLREVYESFKRSEQVDIKALKVKLRGRIPTDFEPENIDERLLRLGRIITLYGIWHIDPDTNLLRDANSVIKKIRELIFEDTKRESITAEEVANLTKLPQWEVELLIKQIRLWGIFWSEVSTASEAGYSEVKVNDKSVFEEYYRYEGVEQLIVRLNERYKSDDSLVDTSDVIFVSDIKPDSDKSGLQHAEHLYQKVKSLYQDTKPLDENTARIIVESADDAIKEFGNTNQEKKAELRQIKERAEEFLPPKTLEELRKRAEGKALKTLHPKNSVLRNALYAVIVLIIIASSLLVLRQTFSGYYEVAKVGPTTTPSSIASPESVPPSQKNAGSIFRPLPDSELKKLQARHGQITGERYFVCEIYNGSDWDLLELTVSLAWYSSIFEDNREGKLITLLLDPSSSGAPNKVSKYSTLFNLDELRGAERYTWHIVSAFGNPTAKTDIDTPPPR